MVDLRKASIGALLALFVSGAAFAAGGAKLDSANIEPGNIASLQRGAANFMNYCSGCHSAKYVRYKTIGNQLGIPEDQLVENLMFTAEKSFETINIAMPQASATRWFGNAPPDLSLVGRAKGADYLYSFLKGFYIDDSRATGVNNTVLAGAAMPHVLWELQGLNRAVFEDHENEDGSVSHELVGFEQVVEGSLSPEEYDDFVRDTVNFLAFIAEPIRSDRRVIGIWVLLFLTLFLILAIMLKKEIWKDIK